jgi:two-component system, NtrC family, sensor histidine kinase HydH
MSNRSKFYILFIVISTVVISYVHYTSSSADSAFDIIFMDLYYIPVLVGALVFGLRGAIIIYIAVLILYFPYILVIWNVKGLLLAEDLLHTLFFGVFAVIAGLLVDRETRHRKRSERQEYLTALGHATGTLAHELRNPLTAISGFARRIREKKGDPDVAVERILDAAQAMHRIVDSTLDFAKPLKLALQKGDVITVVNSALSLCRAKADQHQVKVSLILPPAPLLCILDSFMCERALVNMIDNAIEASGDGESVVITARHEKEHVLITIKDNGSGMDGETLENIFTPFYTTKTNGNGIGMAITKKIIDGHHGIIHIDSKPGHGTEISIKLPCQPPHK